MFFSNDIIERKLSELLNCFTNPLSKQEVEKINEAYALACELHKDKELANGKPFVLHNLNVAITAMKEIGLGPTSTIYIAGGNYTEELYVTKSGLSNEQRLNIVRATNLEHGTDIGWYPSYDKI